MKYSDVKKLERKLTKSIKEHLAAGGKLLSGCFFNNWARCPIICYIGNESGNLLETMSEKSGLTISEADFWRFINGFDSNPNFESESRTAMYLMGRRLRKKFLP